MSLISPTVRPNPISQSVLSEVTITQIIIGITFSLILVEFWRIFLEALIFTKLGISRDSAFQTLIIAVVLTIIVILIITFVNAPVNDLIVGIDPTPVVTSKTQALLGGTPEDIPVAERCDCRDCDTMEDLYNPNTSKDYCRKSSDDNCHRCSCRSSDDNCHRCRKCRKSRDEDYDDMQSWSREYFND